MDREQLERFKRRGRSGRWRVEKIGLQRMAFELMHLEEEKLSQAEKETIAAAKAERDLMSPEVEDAIHEQFMEEYYGISERLLEEQLNNPRWFGSHADDEFP
jgi:hypothetical protein